jgi:mono/diheme cytochrome c family protein
MTPAERGRIVYVTICVACHNINPNIAGSKGPPIAGSPRELVYDRVLFLKYPPGYKPQRNTKNMRAQPQLANKIDDIVAFLAAVKGQKDGKLPSPPKNDGKLPVQAAGKVSLNPATGVKSKK